MRHEGSPCTGPAGEIVHWRGIGAEARTRTGRPLLRTRSLTLLPPGAPRAAERPGGTGEAHALSSGANEIPSRAMETPFAAEKTVSKTVGQPYNYAGDGDGWKA